MGSLALSLSIQWNFISVESSIQEIIWKALGSMSNTRYCCEVLPWFSSVCKAKLWHQISDLDKGALSHYFPVLKDLTLSREAQRICQHSSFMPVCLICCLAAEQNDSNTLHNYIWICSVGGRTWRLMHARLILCYQAALFPYFSQTPESAV